MNPNVVLCGAQLCLIRIMTRPEIMLMQFLMGDFLRLGPWSGYKNCCFGYQGFDVFFFQREKLYYHTLYFSLRIVKSLQLCGRKQFAKPHKYSLVCDFFFFLRIFFSIFASHKSGNFVHIPITKLRFCIKNKKLDTKIKFPISEQRIQTQEKNQ